MGINKDYSRWDLELEGKPDFRQAMDRVNAWYQGEIIDRVPVRFFEHNSFVSEKHTDFQWNSIKDKWYDVEFQVKSFIKSIDSKVFLGETFPIYWPNLGPNVFAAFYGARLEFDDVTSWAEPCLQELEKAENLQLDLDNEYFKKILELTDYALERCEGKFMVGYTDLHPGVDCVAAWRDTQKLCMDFYDQPEDVKRAVSKAMADFQQVYDLFDTRLKAKNQLSVSWMGIPSFGKMHIPSCDFSSMISCRQFEEFCLPVLCEEVKPMTNNIFHLDGKGVARHLDLILEVPQIHAIQWVQGQGDDKPILQWLPLLKKIRNAGKSIVVDLNISELDGFIAEMEPEGVFLCIAADGEEAQKSILKRVEKW